MVKAFAEAGLSGEPAMTGGDGRQVLTIVVAAYRAAETHQPVNLPIKTDSASPRFSNDDTANQMIRGDYETIVRKSIRQQYVT